MKNILMLLFLLSATKLSAQNSTSKKFFDKLVFDKTTVTFDGLKKGGDYTGKISVKNLSDKPLLVQEILKDCGCFDALLSSKKIAARSSIIINVVIKKAIEGPLNRKVFIFFKDEKNPVVIAVKGSFI